MRKPKLNKGAAWKRLTRPALMLLATMPLAGCLPAILTSETRVVYIDTSCTALGPVTYSSRDTKETQDGNREHNAAWDSLCPDGKPKGK